MAQHPKFGWKKFGRDVRESRKALGFGLREMARRLKVHHATWCRVEQGKPSTVPIFLYLCDWMGIDPQHYASRRVTNQ